MYTIFSIPLSVTDPKKFGDEIQASLRQGKHVSISTINPEIVLAAKKDKPFGELLTRFSYRVIDGVGISMLIWLKFAQRIRRITGQQVISALSTAADSLGYSVGLFGAKEGVAKRAGEELSKKYPHAKFFDLSDSRFISVSPRGEINSDDFEKISQPIVNKHIRIILIGLGAPKQEIVMKKIMDAHPTVLAAAVVGGLFDVISGGIKKPPRIISRIGLEWLWRVIQQPSRILRIINAVVIFPIASFFSVKKI